MNSSNIKKHISLFEAHLSEAQWGNGCLVFFSPIGLILVTFLVVIIGLLFNRILGINIFKLISPFKLSLVLSFIFLIYYIGKEVYCIEKDLKMKSYIPVTAAIHKLYIEESQTESGTKYSYFAQLIESSLIIRTSQKVLENKTKITISIQKKTYTQLKEEEYLFFLVGRHSNNWYCTDKRFEVEGLGFSFFP